MEEEIAPKSDVAFDARSAPKSEILPVQVTPIRLTKDNYLSWSAALEIGITSRGRLSYITGDKPAPSKTDPQWATWVLEDSQVKVWIISSVSADIQPLILRKPTSFDMWTVLARMYGRKKRVLRTYQIKRSIYSLKQGDLSVASFYAALKTKWEELDYHVNDNWNCGSDHARY
uniref:Retrotransposon Copia-like N-terminal domain-containing protein n=1 Tax=Nymphaea colorata TaxID=210225 RepID=A0A5K0UXN7_9MAGN